MDDQVKKAVEYTFDAKDSVKNRVDAVNFRITENRRVFRPKWNTNSVNGMISVTVSTHQRQNEFIREKLSEITGDKSNVKRRSTLRRYGISYITRFWMN